MAVPLPPPRIHQEAALASPTSGNRVRAGAIAVNLPPEQAFAAVTEHCRRSGYQVTDAGGMNGRLLVATDPAGYAVTLRQQAGEPPILIVASPPRPRLSSSGKTWIGVAAGAVVGFVLPCLTGLSPLSDLPYVVSANAQWFVWVPFFALGVLGCLLHPAARPFGVGLLIGGSVVGIAMASICTSVISS
ncbi:hypothetical protein [Krasilnikovia sp. MM14-A1259]|uniref:hypothetical protein n=1 Tax=Krasilnikovia sp. MM14-A1259 TaxID=3373539 RepID=UPI00380D5A5C